jgi:hypothetical protein
MMHISMNERNVAAERTQKYCDLEINKGIEFMLRRRVTNRKPRHGLTLSKTFNLLRRTFHFNLEFSWEVDKPTRG